MLKKIDNDKSNKTNSKQYNNYLWKYLLSSSYLTYVFLAIHWKDYI